MEDLFINVSGAVCYNHSVACGSSLQGGELHVIPDNGFGLIQLIFLMAAYGFILYQASNLIADGSEMLTLVLSPGKSPITCIFQFSCFQVWLAD